MNDFLKGVCRGVILGEKEIYNPVYFYGDWRKVRKVLDIIAAGAGRRQNRTITRMSGYTFYEEMVQGIKNGSVGEYKESLPKSGLLIFDGLDRIGGYHSCMKLFYGMFDAVYEHGGQIVIGASYPPTGFASMEDRIITQVSGGIVCCVDEEEIGPTVRELMQMNLWPEKGRFAELYQDKYLVLFSTEPTEKLSDTQMSALGEMKRIVGRLTDLYRGAARVDISRLIRHPKYYSEEVPEEWSAEEVAFGIRFFIFFFFFILHIYYIIFFYKIQINEPFIIGFQNFLGKNKTLCQQDLTEGLGGDY